MHKSSKLIVLTPVFEDSESFAVLLKNLHKCYQDNIYVIAINDGSNKHKISLDHYVNAGVNGEIIDLKRNLGHQRAIALGIVYISKYFNNCDVVVMDSDGEDNPDLIINLRNKMEEKKPDVVIASRGKRFTGPAFKLFYSIYKVFFVVLTGKKINFGNFMLLNPVAIQKLSSMPELWVHLAGTVLLSKIATESITLQRSLVILEVVK